MADEVNPFVAYRERLDVYHRARGSGFGDDAYVELVNEADERVAAVDGRGFRVTPLIDLPVAGPGDSAGPTTSGPTVVAKVETGNVGGSHKARHLFGLLLHLLVDERAPHRRSARPETGRGPLAIASCGNAALGAAVVAGAVERPLSVFVPVDADPVVLGELDRLGAAVVTCERQPGVDGDPCLAALHDALAAGAEPFTVQGPLAPDVIDGGRTLGLELADQLVERGLAPDRIYIQIGGGALATAVMDGLARSGRVARLPALHPVQAATAHPYVAAWRRLAPRLLAAAGLADPGHDAGRAALLVGAGVDGAALAADHADLMVSWPTPPVSVASGILDDITYDWATVMAHQLATGGWPLVVDEDTFIEAAALAAGVTPAPDETGAAGLAGLLTHRRAGGDGSAVVLLTGARRSR